VQLKFRKHNPPMNLLERGDIQHIARQKMLKAAPRCRLCKKPISLDNTHEIIFNGKPTLVHDICPGAKKIEDGECLPLPKLP
jgi:hypothetical protein